MTNTASRFWTVIWPSPTHGLGTSAISSFVTAARSAAATSTTSRRPPPAARASPSPNAASTRTRSRSASPSASAPRRSRSSSWETRSNTRATAPSTATAKVGAVIPATIYRYYLSKRTHFWASASTSQSGGLYKKAREFEKDPTKAWEREVWGSCTTSDPERLS